MVERFQGRNKDAYVEQGFDRGRSRRPPPRIPESDGGAALERAVNQKRVEDGLGKEMPESYYDYLVQQYQQSLLYPDARTSELLAKLNGTNRVRKSSK